MPRPNFFILGAGRCGTTSLFSYLGQHPDVFTSPVKEPNYYALRGPQGDLRGPGAAELLAQSVLDEQGYAALFSGVTTERAIGEASVRYLPSATAAAAIHDDVPDARLIALLRDPAEAVWTSFLGHRLDGTEPCADLRRALESEPKRRAANWAIGSYTARRDYHRHLGAYLAHFPASQLRVYLFEDFVADPAAVTRDVFEFLGVDPAFEPDTSKRLGSTGVLRNRFMGSLWIRSRALRTALRPWLPARLRGLVWPLVSRGGFERPPLPPDLRQTLVERFRPDVCRLEELIGRDLSHWRR